MFTFLFFSEASSSILEGDTKVGQMVDTPESCAYHPEGPEQVGELSKQEPRGVQQRKCKICLLRKNNPRHLPARKQFGRKGPEGSFNHELAMCFCIKDVQQCPGLH